MNPPFFSCNEEVFAYIHSTHEQDCAFTMLAGLIAADNEVYITVT